jgi:hypothetical protein
MTAGQIIDADYTVDDDGSEDASQTIGADAQPANGYVPISKRKPAAAFRALKTNLLADLEASAKWRKQATEDLGFIAGDQLSDEDKELLDEQGRPHIVFNRTETILRAIAGMEINGRHEIQFIPRNTEDTALNEALSAGSKWMADGCDAEDEQSEAFQQGMGTGLGFTESRFAYDDDPEGGYIEEQIDSREMVWDRTARKKNLRDSRRFARLRRMPWADAALMFPNKTRMQVDAVWANNDYLDQATLKSIEEKRIRDGSNSQDEFDDRNEVTVVVCQWKEKENYYRVADTTSNTIQEMSEQDFRRIQERLKMLIAANPGMPSPLHYRKAQRWCFHQAFLGADGLLEDMAPAPCGKQFSWAAITGMYDAKKRMWYGLVRAIRDPQMWANKFMSQIMQIMNATAKGGIMAEADAFDDQREAEDTYAQPDAITWLAPGALSGKKPKIMPKPGQGDASAYVQLLQYAIQSITAVTGFNPEILGQQDQEQPGILEHMRKQAAMTVLAVLFDSLRGFLKLVGRKRLFYLQNRMSDGRLVRVVGKDLTKAVPLMKDKTAGTYDVIVSDAPTSPNMKEATWAVMQPLLVAFKDVLIGNPVILAQVLEYSPLPSALVENIKSAALASKNDPQNQQFEQIIKHLQIAKEVAGINKDQSTAEMNNAKAGSTGATASYDLAMAQNLLAKNDMDGFNHHIQAMAEAAKAEKAKADAAKTNIQAAREAQGVHHDAQAHELDVAERTQNLRQGQNAGTVEMHRALTDRIHAHLAARKQGSDEVHQAHDRAISTIGAIAGMHKDLAAAHRDRIGAVVDARPEPQPAAAQ